MQRQKGQAVMEFMVASLFVLAPAIYLVIHLGKVGDIQHRAYEGARYSIWEKAKTGKSNAEIQNEINKRIFYQDYREIDSVSDRANNNSTAKLEPLYTHRADDGSREAFVILKDGTFNTSTSSATSAGEAYDTRISLVNGVTDVMSFDLDSDGIVTSTVSMTTSKSKYLNGMSIQPRAWNSMVLEDWRQVTPKRVKNAIEDSLAANAIPFEQVAQLLQGLGSILGLPEWEEFEWGYVAPDITGCTRTVGGSGNEAAC